MGTDICLLRPLVCDRFLPLSFPFQLPCTNSCVFKRPQYKPSLIWRSLIRNRTNSTNKSRSLEASSSPSTEAVPCILWKLKVITEFPIVNKNPVYNHLSYFCKARFISSSYLRLGSHALFLSSPCFDRPDNTEMSGCRVPEQSNMGTQHSWAALLQPISELLKRALIMHVVWKIDTVLGQPSLST